MKEKMTTVLLPRGRKQEENFVIVSVNGRSWKIMRRGGARTGVRGGGAGKRRHDGGGGPALCGRESVLR